MHKRGAIAKALSLAAAACAAVAVPYAARAATIDPGTIITGCQYKASGIVLNDGNYANLQCNSTGQLITTGSGGGGGGGGGSVTAAGVNGTSAQAVQGINGGVPLQVLNTLGGSAVSTGNPLPVVTQQSGAGADTVFLTSPSTSGTSIGTLPAGDRGVIIHLPPGAGVSFYIATSQAASAAAAATVAQTYFNPASSTTNLDLQENLSGSYQVWVTNVVNGTATTFVSGLPVYRFI